MNKWRVGTPPPPNPPFHPTWPNLKVSSLLAVAEAGWVVPKSA
jgi:hypothetical protein